MYCPNCGEKLAEGSKFCSACGSKIEAAAPEVKQTAEAPVEPVQPVVAAPVAQESEIVRPKKKLDVKKILIAVAALVVVAVVAVLLVMGLSGGEDGAYVYMSDGSYELLTELKKGESIEIASLRSDLDGEYRYPSLVRFSPDGKYVYYYTKVDEGANTGSLNRAEFAKLKDDSKKNDKYIDVIATNVQLGFRFFNDGTLAYRNGDNALYYYDGENANSVAKKINSYYIDAEGGRIVYTVSNNEDGSQILYGILTDDLDNKIKLASNVSSVYYPTDFNSIFYTKVDEEYVQSLYVVGFEKEAEKVGSRAQILSVNGSSVCFTEDEGNAVSLYDYVTDGKMASDAAITEPNRDDFSVPEYRYYMIYTSTLNEGNYSDLYTSCTKDLYWYGMSTWNSYSMEEAVNETWIENSDEIQAATQEFMDKFADRANEDGFIPVTDDVKAALKKIDSYASEKDVENTWLWLCYSKEQNGYTYDYDAYYAACDVYEEAEDRIQLREELQNSENDRSLMSLYVYENGTKTLICDNMLDYEWIDGGILYNTTDLIAEKLDLEEMYDTYDVQELFYMDYEAQNYILPLGAAGAYQLSEDAAFTFSEAFESSYADLTVAGDAVYMQEGNGALSVAAVANGVVDDFKIITDDGMLASVGADKVYYINGTYDNDDVTYGDLYAYEKGESTLLARDVVVSHYDYSDYYVNGASINIYEDDVILAYTGYGRYGYELTMYDKKGDAEVVADDVSSYVRVDSSTLLLISDGDLYCYNGKEKTKLHSDVEYLWCKDFMAATTLY